MRNLRILSGVLLFAGSVSVGWASSLDKVSASLMAKAQTQRVSVMAEMLDKADLSGAAAIQNKIAKTQFVANSLQATAQASQSGLTALLDAAGVAHRSFWIANVVYFQADDALLRQVAELPQVAMIHEVKEPEFAAALLQPALAKADGEDEGETETSIEPGLALVGAPQVWELGVKGQGVVVGDHDIGVEWDHPALINQYRGWDGASADHAFNWRNAFGPNDPFCDDAVVPCDSHGHGTHTTGTMVGDDGAGMQIGMAPQAQWMACRSLWDPVVGVGTLPTYLDCMEWFVAPYPEGQPELADPAQAPDVINNSWGCLEACPPTILQAADEATKAAGIVQVGSAGNEGSDCNTIAFPLSIYDSTFTVGSTTFDDEMSSFSSRGPVVSDLSLRIKPNVVAPGSNVNSSDLGASYGTKSGTSMASPHVAGLVALMISAEPRLRGQVDLIRQIIQDTAVPIETTQSCGDTGPSDIPNSVFGFGRIDALAAVLAIPSYLDGPVDEEAEEPAEEESDERAGDLNRGGALPLWLVMLLSGAVLRRATRRI